MAPLVIEGVVRDQAHFSAKFAYTVDGFPVFQAHLHIGVPRSTPGDPGFVDKLPFASRSGRIRPVEEQGGTEGRCRRQRLVGPLTLTSRPFGFVV